MTTDHNEAMRLAEWLKARQSHLGSSRESCWDGEQRCWDNYDQAAALLRKQAERIAELEARVHTCGPTCSKAGCINLRLAAERDTLRAEVERLKPNAERYEWLRAAHWSSAPLCCVLEPKASVRLGATCPSGDQLDTAIDNARKATQ